MLKDTLKQDMIAALKSGDSAKRTLIGMVISSIKNKELEKRGKLIKTVTDSVQLEAESQLTEQETMDILASEIKRRRDSVAEFTKGGRPELADSEQAEIEVLTTYLPEQLSDDELRDIIQKAITTIRSTGSGQAGAKDIGKVMSVVKEEVKGTADGQRISTIVKELLK